MAKVNAIVKVVEGEVVETALAIQTRVEIETQIATAKMYPRDIEKYKDTLEGLIKGSISLAEDCFYVLPRGDGIPGPTVRLAELVANNWGNIVIQAETLHTDEKYVYARAQCRDLEKNVAYSLMAKRRITKTNGTRYNDDMIGVTAMAACSVALRNAIFKVVPGSMWMPFYEMARSLATGDAKTWAAQRTRVMKRLQKLGVDEARVLASVRKEKVEDITPDEVTKLIGFGTAIKHGDTAIDDAFPEVQTEPVPSPEDVKKAKATTDKKDEAIQEPETLEQSGSLVF